MNELWCIVPAAAALKEQERLADEEIGTAVEFSTALWVLPPTSGQTRTSSRRRRTSEGSC